MKFVELTLKEQQLFLEAIGYNKSNLKCSYCKKKLRWDKRINIMPPATKEHGIASICCGILCLAEYFEDTEGIFEDTEIKEMKK